MAVVHQTPGYNQHTIQRISFDAPIADVPTFYTATVYMSGPRATYTPAALDSLPPSGLGIAGRLVEQSPLEHTDGDILVYSRTYSSPPPTHYRWEQYAATFPAIEGALLISMGRGELVKVVTSRIRYRYQRVPGDPFAGGNLQPNISIDMFPVQPDPVFKIMQGDVEVSVLSYTSGTPTAQYYLDNIVGTEIAWESEVSQWMGNIYAVKTRYVVPQ